MDTASFFYVRGSVPQSIPLMQIHPFTVGPFAENTYLLAADGEALLIDPGFYEESEFRKFTRKLDEEASDLSAVILTHAHVDHILGLQRVKDAYDVPVYLSERDRYLWEHAPSQAKMFGFQIDAFDFEPEPLPDGGEWQIGSFSFDVRYTPGHAPDHVSLYSSADGLVIAGDALFREGIGRTDLYRGSFEVLKESIEKQLYTLPDDTVVYPGHGPETTVGHEKCQNPFVKA